MKNYAIHLKYLSVIIPILYTYGVLKEYLSFKNQVPAECIHKVYRIIDYYTLHVINYS